VAEEFSESKEFHEIQEVVKGHRQALADHEGQEMPQQPAKYLSTWEKTVMLSHRSFQRVVRDPSLLMLQVMVVMMAGGMIGAVFWQV
jgi:hypothetical protein